MSSHGADLVAEFLNIRDIAGTFPNVLCMVEIPMITKVPAGRRLVGSLRALIRLHGRARRRRRRAWEMAETSKDASFKLAVGRAVADGVWRQKVKVTYAQSKGHHVAVLLLDLYKCDEMVLWPFRVYRCQAVEYAMILLRRSIDLCTCCRTVVSYRVASRPVFPARVITAGSYSAMYALEVLMRVGIRIQVKAHPDVGLLVHVDDIAQEKGSGKPISGC